MNSKMTPCEKLGYKVGDRFEMTASGYGWSFGDVVKLVRDDGSICPEFEGVTAKNSRSDDNKMFMHIDDETACVKRIRAKLKPAKQALADAIHQNGGWICGKYAVYGKQSGKCTFLTCKPQYFTKDQVWLVTSSWIVGEFEMKPFINWHQCILSRDEYFTAYPEQVMVEVKNETKHKVEVEMKSESEMTIKVSYWHKNGELPPVGEVCIFDPNGRTEFFDEKAIGAIGKEVSIISHVKFKGAVGGVAVFMCDSDGVAIVRTASETCFRPLRTERDKAIDEMVSLVEPLATYREFAGTIYDAGMYKEVK